MSSESVCRLCLAIDAPVFVTIDSPLRQVYEKLTNVSWNAAHKPVVACSLCHWQLRKCHKLMSRSSRADELLTKILQTGALINRESISMIDRKTHKLVNSLSISAMKLGVFVKPECKMKEEKIKDEALSNMNEEGMEREPITCAGNIKIENDMEDVAEEGLGSVYYVIHEGLSDVEDVMNEQRQQLNYTDDEIDIQDIKSESVEDTRDGQVEGAAPTEKCEQIHAEQTEHGSTLTPDDNQEKRTIRRTVTDEESPSRSVGRYMFHSIRNIPNNRQVLPNTRIDSDTATNNINVSVSSDNDCNTDVDNSSSKHVKKMFICNDCGNVFDDKYLLIEHIEHHNVVKKNCNRCSPRRTILRQQSSSRTGVNKQTETHSGKDPIQCEICQRRFTCKSSLNRHLLVHTGEKPFECEICKVKFNRQGNLKTHLLVHMGEKPFECDVCEVRFSDKGNLNKHLTVHTGEKPFKCEICKVRFTRTYALKRHLLVHTGEKPFECEICKVRVREKCELKKHLRVHTGEKPFECEICKVRFSQKCYLKRHLLVHTGEKLNVKYVKFRAKGTLRAHLRTH